MNKIKSFIKEKLFIIKLIKLHKNKRMFQFLEDNNYYFINSDGNKEYKMPDFK